MRAQQQCASGRKRVTSSEQASARGRREDLNEGLELLGVEGLAARVDKGADPVLVRRRRRVRVPVLVPVPVLRVTLLCVRVTMFVTMRRMRVTVAVAVGGRVSLRLLSEAHCAANVLVVVRSSRRAALAPEHLLQRDLREWEELCQIM